MATGAKVSYNHFQSGKFGTMTHNQIKDMEISPDMHLKMSKKIAQLTKVIYALNTKNDENETLIASAKEHHEEQIGQVFQEIRIKVENMQRQINAEKEQNSQILELKSRLESYEKHKQNAMVEFEEYKKIKDAQTKEMETGHSKRVIEMSHEVLMIKKEFQQRMAHLEDLQRKLDSEKESALQAEREKHQNELDELTNRLQNSSELTLEQKRAQDEYTSRIQELSDKYNVLSNEKDKIIEEYELKLNKLQSFHEKELQALKSSQSTDTDTEVQQLRDELQKVIKDFSREKADMNKKIEGLLGQVSEKEEEVENLNTKLNQLQAEIISKDEMISALEDQILQYKAKSAERQKELEELKIKNSELTKSDEKKGSEVKKLTVEIEKANSIREDNEKHISDLQGKLSSAQERIRLLESSKRALEGQTSEQSKQLLHEIEGMNKQLSELTAEMKKKESEHKKELEKISSSFTQKEEQLKTDHREHLDKTSKDHENEKEQMKNDHEFKLLRVKEEISAQLDAEISRLMLEKQQVEQSSEVNRNSLMNRLSTAEMEVKKLNTQLKEQREACEAAKTKLKSATSQAEKFQRQLEGSNVDLTHAKKECKNLESKIAALEKELEARVSAKDAEAKHQKDQLMNEMNNKWMDKIQKECLKITDQITKQKNEELQAALKKLTREKDAEIQSLQSSTKKEIQDLKKQLMSLQSYADNIEGENSKQREAEQAAAEAEMKALREEMLEAANDYATKIESMQTLYMRQLADLTDQKEREKMALEEEMKSFHLEEINRMMTENASILEATERQAEESLQRALDKEKTKREERLAMLRTELLQKHGLEMEQTTRAHQQQIVAARMELERAIELGKQKDVEHQLKVNEMEETVRYRMLTIRTMEEDIKKLERSVSDMSKDLEAKGKEVLFVRSEANKATKLCEERLIAIHRDDIEQISEEYMIEKQKMLSEFMEAQELLKDKISACNIMLEEAEERYKNRESREEDLDKIRQLQLMVQEREAMLRKLNDEKRKFQMELVNRETNFNKVFNSNPQVGILNPLAPAKPRMKKGEKPVTKYAGSNTSLNSVGSTSTRLQPLPNSPIHDEQLNHTRPLPPTKKFVK